MTVKRVQFSNIVQNQLPEYVRSDFPLISEFLKTYYQAQEFQGAPIDLIQNIDQYTKISEQTGLVETTTLDANITEYDTTIPVQATIPNPVMTPLKGICKIINPTKIPVVDNAIENRIRKLCKKRKFTSLVHASAFVIIF